MSPHYSVPLSRHGKCDSDVGIRRNNMKKLIIVGIVIVAVCATTAWIYSLRKITYCKRCFVEFSSTGQTYWGHQGERLERSKFCEEVDGHIPTKNEEESGSMVNWQIKVNGTD
jgi:hypothetical protein